MTITVTNQKPAVLDALHTISCTGDYDPMPAIQKVLVDPLLEPLNPSAPASIVDGSGHDITGNVLDIVMRCLGETMDPVAEKNAKELLGQTMVSYDQATPLPVGELFAVQAGQQNKWPAPSARVFYTAQNDVIPAAKGLLAGSADESAFFASIAYAYHPNTLGFWFQSSAAFDGFKIWLNQQVQAMAGANAMPADTLRLLNDFANLSLKGLTESLLLRKDDSDGNDEFSFARLVIRMLMTYVEQQRKAASAGASALDTGIMPFTVAELFCPRSLVLVNVEAHARATAAKVTGEWNLINQSLASPVKVVSNAALSKLTSLPRAAARAAAMGARQQPGQPGSRSAQVKFRKAPPTKLDLFKDITRVLKRMGKVNKSQNVYRTTKTTFLKANRRNPDDFNKPGRITSVQYMPDLHVFIDTSGSISEENYQEAVLMLIRIAKKLNVNLYFNSFSHMLSQETLLKVENKSTRQIWQEFRKVPKVTGGTEFKQVWDYINASQVRKRRLSLMITDFEWSTPSRREDHPPNLYYAPCSAMDWKYMVRSAETYANGMQHIDPSIRQKLLGMVL
ncbi:MULTISPECIES: hypothetical protein [Paenarthrobacter]|uniref:VWA-like domain-containing protein n=1 Tax=Paenarthrobacter ureafaciens TaxID=37931 RepID=A0AAX3EE23_PAEUR|nr:MULTISPECIES: hypothetical protein [Paenarthrobacter]NKR13318.1 hypothetical protein [Arthrobacter sp. M5]NKR14832.1 hypothetical protein [Arthrobacter sp. M6]OEH62385.1 hypothetical protein A5N13_01635 [Arthrobacter sp. D4]OEH62956.1 hypothetical protein A5N17_09875 [Arthrobacter sp. D2]MDO5865131.1 hypothetical protein [Paenarthrobacter sp. SD-2]